MFRTVHLKLEFLRWFAVAIPSTLAAFGINISTLHAQQNWQQFRGAEARGIGMSPALPDRWSATENIEWKRDLPGRGWSSPIVWGNRLFVTSVVNQGETVEVIAEDKNGKTQTFEAEYCLVAIGRRPYTDGLGLENLGIETVKGKIPVNEHLETKVPGIYAIGDVIDGPMLAHKAEEEGVFVAEYMAGQKPHINYLLIPGVVYTWPEVASVGYTEEQLKEKGTAYKVGSFPFRALGRARASMDIDGLVKILADKTTDEILGVHIIGPRAADMIAAGVTAMEYRASAEDVARMSHAHPTYMEAVKEACLAATDNRALHI